MGTLRVRNVAQKVLWEQELSGQLSDGQWENATPWDHWKPWCNATVVIDPDNVGRDFYARRESYNFTAKDLLDCIGDRMLNYVRVATGNSDYNMKAMKADLNDLKKIIKENVRSDVPIPRQPRTWRAKLVIDGYPQVYTTYVQVDDDPKAVELLAKRDQDTAKYRLKNVEKDIERRLSEVAKLEVEAATLRATLGVFV